MKRVGIVFHGRVQGVGFRATTRQLARGFAVTGWVRNEPDGTVRLEVQGSEDEVEGLLAAIENRLGHGIVRQERAELSAVADEQGFEIRYL